MHGLNFIALRERLAAVVEDGTYSGVASLVWRHGEVIACETAGWRDISRGAAFERDTIFRLASMSKPITSAAAMMLVDDGVLDLAAPIEQWLPEAADLHVLLTPEASLDNVVPAIHPPTLLELMTHTAGFAWGKGLDLPVTRAMDKATGTTPFIPFNSDELARRMCEVPLVRQPGAGWHYSNGTDLLGVILSRACSMSLPDLLQERLFGPLSMVDTGFWVPSEKRDRFAFGNVRRPDGGLDEHDSPADGFWTRAPVCPSGGGGLVSTIDDYLAFSRMLLEGGISCGGRILSETSIRLMTSNQLKPAQLRPVSPAVDFLRGQGFGLGVAVALADTPGGRSRGSFSWPGGYGTSWFADPNRGTIAILVTQVWQEHLAQLGPAFEADVCSEIDREAAGPSVSTVQ